MTIQYPLCLGTALGGRDTACITVYNNTPTDLMYYWEESDNKLSYNEPI